MKKLQKKEKVLQNTIERLFKISRQRVKYWREIGLLSVEKNKSGYYEYDFHDLATLKTIRTLQDKGFTTYQIKQALTSLKNKLKINKPFVEKRIVAVGNRIAYVDRGSIYDALTGQKQIFVFDEIKSWTKEVKKKEPDLLFVFNRQPIKQKSGG